MGPAEMTKLPVALLFAAAWLFAGAALLWAGGRFLARIPKVTVFRSLVVRLCHGAAAWAILGLARWGYVAVGLQAIRPGVVEAMLISSVTVLAFWLIIAWVFDTSFPKATLCWLPMAGEWYVLLLGVLILPDLPFWPHLAAPGAGR